MHVRVGAIVAVALALGLLGILLTADSAQAVGEEVNVLSDYEQVMEGDSVLMEVTFGQPDDDRETISVDCQACPGPWTKTIFFDSAKSGCQTVSGRDTCRISFPEGFTDAQGVSARSQGEPHRKGQTYTVRVSTGVGDDAIDTFQPVLTSAYTCREQEVRRHEILRFQTTGHSTGDQVTLSIRDASAGRTIKEKTQFASSPAVPILLTWSIPLDYPLGSDGLQEIVVEVDNHDDDSKDETEDLDLLPGKAIPRTRIDLRPTPPGQDPDPDFNRTQTVRLWFQMAYLAAPLGCDEVAPGLKVSTVDQSALANNVLQAEVRKIDTSTSTPDQDRFEVVKHIRASFIPGIDEFWFNYTIPKDAEATREGVGDFPGNPVYQIVITEKPLADGNIISRKGSSDFVVHPYDIIPKVHHLPDEVERLETAEVVFNLTYGDGSPVTPEDVSSDLEVDFKPVAESQPREQPRNLTYQGDGLWNASIPLDFHYEPLGEYQWILRANTDDHGSDGFHNRIPRTATRIFDVVPAKPVINMRTYVGSEEVDGVQRTRTVHVSLTAIYKNGIPITSDNVDPGDGGVVLNVKKTNRFGRILDIDSLLMTDADGQGTWVRTFRVPRSEDAAPIGTWELEVVAGDDRDPSNKNVTGFPFEVEPARVTVSPVVTPPDMVTSGQVHYRFRLTYPDGSLFTEQLAASHRGGSISVALERLNFLNQTRTEMQVRPDSLQGGQDWEVRLDARELIPGPHFFNVTGRDIHGNVIGPKDTGLFTVMFHGEFRNSTTPICPGPPRPEAEEPQCSLPRGQDVFVLFPKSEGDHGFFTPNPIVNVFRKPPGEDRWTLHEQDIRVDPATFEELSGGRRPGDNHAGVFQTDRSTPVGTYVLFIIGRAENETGFAGFSTKFEIGPIQVQRETVQALPDQAAKGEEVLAILQAKPGDVVDEVVVRAGPVTFRNAEALPVSRDKGTFVRWEIPRSAPTGPFVIDVEGRDLFGNNFTAQLGPTQILPSKITVDVTDPPPVEVPRRRPASLTAKMAFVDGASFTDRQGIPEVEVFTEDGQRLGQGRVTFTRGDWIFEYTPAHDDPLGPIHFRISGEDRAGNVIETFESRPIVIVPGTTDADGGDLPRTITRGDTVSTTLRFPSDVHNVSASITTGAADLGEPVVQVDGRNVTLSYQTDRTTDLVLARFHVEGKDANGNRIDEDTELFQINPQQLTVRFLNQPPPSVLKGETVTVDFTLTYPDGTRMRPGEGTPVAGMFVRDTPLGSVQARPLPENPTVWRLQWEPPGDVRTGIPYVFGVSGLDRWQNEAPPQRSTGFIIEDPTVPNYLATPGPNPVVMLVLGGVAALLLARRARDGHP